MQLSQIHITAEWFKIWLLDLVTLFKSNFFSRHVIASITWHSVPWPQYQNYMDLFRNWKLIDLACSLNYIINIIDKLFSFRHLQLRLMMQNRKWPFVPKPQDVAIKTGSRNNVWIIKHSNAIPMAIPTFFIYAIQLWPF